MHSTFAQTLRESQRRAFDEQGFYVFPSVVDAGSLSLLRALCDNWSQDPSAIHQGGNQQLGEISTRHQPIIDVLHLPQLIDSAWHILRRPSRLNAVAFRAPKPGAGLQALHTDWMPRADALTSFVVTAILMLDDFTEENGATRVVPGSHRLLAVPRLFATPSKRHPEEVNILGRAGSLLLFNGHLWHSGTKNESNTPRRALQIVLTAQET
jgi:Phytanoyl-CoA dioxygenase (PhyH)